MAPPLQLAALTALAATPPFVHCLAQPLAFSFVPQRRCLNLSRCLQRTTCSETWPSHVSTTQHGAPSLQLQQYNNQERLLSFALFAATEDETNDNEEATTLDEDTESKSEQQLESAVPDPPPFLALGYKLAAFANLLTGLLLVANIGSIASTTISTSSSSLASAARSSADILSSSSAAGASTRHQVNLLATYKCLFFGYILGNALSSEYVSALNNVHTSLPIDTTKKKTAAARRFFCTDEDDLDWIREELVRVIEAGLKHDVNSEKDDENEDEKKVDKSRKSQMQSPPQLPAVQILPHMRFLEYTQPNKSLGPHTDALIRDKITGEWSTHTLLVFCTDCKVGGETTLLPEDAKVTRMREKNLQKEQRTVEEVKYAIDRVSTQQGVNTTEVNDEASIDNDTTTSASASAARLEQMQTALTSAQNRVSTLQNEQSTISQQCFPVQPQIGRIFFFPHGCPHEGRPTVSVPKIFLGAELILRSNIIGSG